MAGVHYSMAKSAVITITRQMAAEAAEFGININCVAPSQTKTEMLEPLNDHNAKGLNQYPSRRFATPDEQANVIMFLASDLSSYG